MRVVPFTFVGVLSFCVVAGAACGSAAVKSSATTTSTGGSGGSTGTSPDEDAGSDAPAFTEGPVSAPPQVADYGGPVLKEPKIVPVFFAGDDAAFQAQLADFVSKVGQTTYWKTAVEEYGVGAATALPPVQLTETAAAMIDDTKDLQPWLAAKLNGNDPLWPANDANTVYALHYPAGTTITFEGAASCSGFGGYHFDTQLDAAHGGAYVAYAVIPRCMSFDTTPPLMGIDAVTGAESHELVEAVTDPYPQDDPAYVTVDDPHYYWSRVLGGGEVGDMCAQFPGAFTKFPGLDYTVQRIWSNKNEKAGHDPCQPALTGEVYFNAAPVLSNVMVSIMGTMISVKGVEIPLGQSQTIDVQLFSDAPTSGPWTVSAENYPPNSSPLSFSWDKTTGVNGDVLHLTITVKTAGKRGTESFVLKSTLGTQEFLWIGLVATPVVSDGGVDSGSDGGGFQGDAGVDSGSVDDGGDDGGDGG